MNPPNLYPHQFFANCPKCGFPRGSDSTTTEYCSSNSPLKPVGRILPLCDGIEGDHLHVVCGRCTYLWFEECADRNTVGIKTEDGRFFPRDDPRDIREKVSLHELSDKKPLDTQGPVIEPGKPTRGKVDIRTRPHPTEFWPTGKEPK